MPDLRELNLSGTLKQVASRKESSMGIELSEARSADFESAVSQNCILQVEQSFRRAEISIHPADCKSAIQQIKNLRYVLPGCLCFAFLLTSTLVRAGALEQKSFLPLHATIVLLSGLAGDLESENAYRDQLQAWLDLAATRQPQQVLVLCENPEMFTVPAKSDEPHQPESRITHHASRITLPATRTNVLDLSQKFSKTNPIVFILWGHGGKQGSTPVFHVRGPRITPADLKAVAEGLPEVESRWMLMFRGSGAFARQVAGPNRFVVSSERDTMFTSDPMGMPLLLKIVRGSPEAPFERVAEEFGRATAAWYQERNLARTEEPTFWNGRANPRLLITSSNENSFASARPEETPESQPSAKPDAITSNLPPIWEGIRRVDPKNYADADAVLLKRRVSFTLASNPALASEQEEFIQILNPEGKRFGDFDISYSPPFEEVNFLDCEVLNSEGKLARLDPEAVREGRDESVAEYQFGRRKIFSLPAVASGAVLHVRYRTQWKDFPLPHVSLEIPLAKEMPVRDSIIEVSVPKESPFHFAFEHLPTDGEHLLHEPKEAASRTAHESRITNHESRITDPLIKQSTYGTTYTWQFSELLAQRHEILGPPGHRPRLLVSTFADWPAFAGWYARISQLADEVTPEIETKAKELARDAKSDRDKVLALYNYVARLRYVAVPLGINSFRPHAAANVLKNQYGDCKDKANLLNALLRALNLQANLVLVPRFGQAHDAIPGLAFNHAISQVKLGAQALWVDTTDEVCRFGMLPPGDAGRKVLVIDGQTSTLSQLPVPPADEHELKLRGEVNCQNFREALPGTLNATARGFPDYELRAAAREVKEHEASLPLLEAGFRPAAGSFALEQQNATAVSALDEDFSWKADGSWIGLASASSGQGILRAPFFLPKQWSLALHRRQGPLFLNEGYPLSLDEEFSFAMPAGGPCTLPEPKENKAGPLSWKVEWTNSAPGKLSARFTAELRHGELSLEETPQFQQELAGLLNALAAGANWPLGR